MTECCCCADDEMTKFITCGNGHNLCSDCAENGLSSAIGNMNALKCPDASRCDVVINEYEISKLVLSKIFDEYSKTLMRSSINNLDNLHKCNFCDYAVIIEGEIREFHCVMCSKIYCHCKKELHPGVACNAEIYSEAEELTRRYIIRCTCGVGLVKQDACNHLICTQCSSRWCWYCKQQGWHDGVCPLYEEQPEAQDATISSANIANAILRNDPLEQARRANEERARIARATEARIEQERLARLERERLERERVERERLARLERERVERERIEQERLARLERERLERERQGQERIKNEKLLNIKMAQLELELQRPVMFEAHDQHDLSNLVGKERYNEACIRGCTKVVKRHLATTKDTELLSYGLYLAIKHNQYYVVQLLLTDDRINTDCKDDKFIKIAIKYDYAEIIKLLLTNENVCLIDYHKMIKTSHTLGHELITLYLLESKLLHNA